MTPSTTHTRRVTALALSLGALAIAAPVAQAQAPDAFERAVHSEQSQHRTFVGSPDAIDRAIAARQEQSKLVALDIRERALTERPASVGIAAPDAFERALVTHTDALTAQTLSRLDEREQALVSRPVSTPSLDGPSNGFDWSDFGLGAGAGIGLMLVLLGLGAGVLALRRDYGRVTTA